MNGLRLVLVEDDPSFRDTVAQIFRASPHVTCDLFADASAFLAAARNHYPAPDLVLMDLCSPADREGEFSLASLPELRRRFPATDVWVQSGVEDIARMKRAIRAGAHRFVSKEGLLGEAPLLLAQLAELRAFRAEAAEAFRGDSPLARKLRECLADLRFASNADVLLEGETGTGKEVCAQLLKGDAPWVAVNCSAVAPELFEAEFFGAERGAFTGAVQARAGYLETAQDGVLFLDEVQALPLAHQAKLLRALETRTFRRVGASAEQAFRARVVSASNVRLAERVLKGHFREDLYYRLAVTRLQLPPLRARSADIGPLLEGFLREASQGRVRAHADALAWASVHYDWPGNVRELRAVAKRLTASAKIPLVDAEALAAEVVGENVALPLSPLASSVAPNDAFLIDWSLGLDGNVEKLERRMLESALRSGKSAQARERLGMGRSRYYEKLRDYGLSTETADRT